MFLDPNKGIWEIFKGKEGNRILYTGESTRNIKNVLKIFALENILPSYVSPLSAELDLKVIAFM